MGHHYGLGHDGRRLCGYFLHAQRREQRWGRCRIQGLVASLSETAVAIWLCHVVRDPARRLRVAFRLVVEICGARYFSEQWLLYPLDAAIGSLPSRHLELVACGMGIYQTKQGQEEG